MKRTKFDAKKIKKNLDILWSKFIRARDKSCQKCGKTGATQAAHIFSRNNLQVRWNPRNGIGLCFYCHLYWAHRSPVEFTLWIKQRIGERDFRELERTARGNFDSSKLRLKKEVEKIKEAIKL